MKVNGKMEGQMAKAAIKTQKMPFFKVSVKTTYSRGLGLKRGPMAPNTKAITKTVRSMAMVFTHGMMAHILKEIGSMAP